VSQARTCVIFDIDGTLLDSTETDNRVYAAALQSVLGELTLRAHWHDYEHVTDEGILRAVCLDNGLDFDTCREQVRAKFGELMVAHLADTRACPPIPGAQALFEQLRDSHRFQIGIATGGWGHTARLKTSARGLPHDRGTASILGRSPRTQPHHGLVSRGDWFRGTDRLCR
jgi:beta-phosphoglucomutase-like phosphatase (HAD superfamily)